MDENDVSVMSTSELFYEMQARYGWTKDTLMAVLADFFESFVSDAEAVREELREYLVSRGDEDVCGTDQ